ncbi:MAG: hypothetical protein HUU54_10985 [Ignavibacteriaceae bacterium]|nr:hypothetical protein [Ignavibacteriaceae bacterium]
MMKKDIGAENMQIITSGVEWNIQKGDYVSEDPGYVKRHELAKKDKRKEILGFYFTLSVIGLFTLIFIVNLAARIKI